MPRLLVLPVMFALLFHRLARRARRDPVFGLCLPMMCSIPRSFCWRRRWRASPYGAGDSARRIATAGLDRAHRLVPLVTAVAGI